MNDEARKTASILYNRHDQGHLIIFLGGKRLCWLKKYPANSGSPITIFMWGIIATVVAFVIFYFIGLSNDPGSSTV
jgi:hypothetical protein